MTRPILRLRFVVGAVVVLLAAAVCSSSSDDDDAAASATAAATVEDVGVRTVAQTESGSLALETTSTCAAYVSAGDVLVSLSGDAAADAVVELNGTDVTDAFAADGDVRRGLVTGLVDGKNTLTATAGEDTVELDVTSHSKNGPLFSGPHLEPWVCTTEAAGLGAATDADCDAPATTTWSYRATGRVDEASPGSGRTAGRCRDDHGRGGDRAVRHPHRDGRDRSRHLHVVDARSHAGRWRSVGSLGVERPARIPLRRRLRDAVLARRIVHGRRRQRPARTRLRRRDRTRSTPSRPRATRLCRPRPR